MGYGGNGVTEIGYSAKLQTRVSRRQALIEQGFDYRSLFYPLMPFPLGVGNSCCRFYSGKTTRDGVFSRGGQLCMAVAKTVVFSVKSCVTG
jgi:hypothetical protein